MRIYKMRTFVLKSYSTYYKLITIKISCLLKDSPGFKLSSVISAYQLTLMKRQDMTKYILFLSTLLLFVMPASAQVTCAPDEGLVQGGLCVPYSTCGVPGQGLFSDGSCQECGIATGTNGLPFVSDGAGRCIPGTAPEPDLPPTTEDVVFSFPDSDDRFCGALGDTAVNNQCAQRGCTRFITAEQEAVASGQRIERDRFDRTTFIDTNVKSMMEGMHNSWHGTADMWTRPLVNILRVGGTPAQLSASDRAMVELGGQSFFAMHSTMLARAQQRLLDAGLPCMPGIKRLNRSMSFVQGLVEGVPQTENTNAYNRSYNQWITARQGGVNGAGNPVSASTQYSLGVFGAYVQLTFHNNLHNALDTDGLLLTSNTATRKGLFWIIHSLVDYQVNEWLVADSSRRFTDWQCDYLRMDMDRNQSDPNCFQTPVPMPRGVAMPMPGAGHPSEHGTGEVVSVPASSESAPVVTFPANNF